MADALTAQRLALVVGPQHVDARPRVAGRDGMRRGTRPVAMAKQRRESTVLPSAQGR